MPCHPDRVRRNYDEAPVWRRPSENAAAQLQPATPCDHTRLQYDHSMDAWRCPCGLILTPVDRDGFR